MEAHEDVPQDVEKVLAEARQVVEDESRARQEKKREQAEATRKTQEKHLGDLVFLLYQEYDDTLLPYFDTPTPDALTTGDNDTKVVVLDLPRCAPISFQVARHYRKPWAVDERGWRKNTWDNEWYTYRIATFRISEDYELDGLHEDRFIVHEGERIHTNDLTRAIGAAQIEEQKRVALLAKAEEMNANYREHREEDMAAGRDRMAPAPPPPLVLTPAEEQMILAWRALIEARTGWVADLVDPDATFRPQGD